MHHRKQTKVLFALVFFTVALLSYSPIWAQSATPNFTETIIDGNTRVQTASDGTVTVSFWDEVMADWVPAQPQQGVICICKGAGCSDNLQDNLDIDPDPAPYEGDPPQSVDVQCYTIKQAGAGTTGCLVSRNPRTYLIGGDAYTRP